MLPDVCVCVCFRWGKSSRVPYHQGADQAEGRQQLAAAAQRLSDGKHGRESQDQAERRQRLAPAAAGRIPGRRRRRGEAVVKTGRGCLDRPNAGPAGLNKPLCVRAGWQNYETAVRTERPRRPARRPRPPNPPRRSRRPRPKGKRDSRTPARGPLEAAPPPPKAHGRPNRTLFFYPGRHRQGSSSGEIKAHNDEMKLVETRAEPENCSLSPLPGAFSLNWTPLHHLQRPTQSGENCSDWMSKQ